MAEREVAPTRIALLELLDERRLVQEGYQLLDERRMLLAARMLRGLDELGRRRRALETVWGQLLERLRQALVEHGLHELEAWPPAGTALTVGHRSERVLGVEVGRSVAAVVAGKPAWPPARPAQSIDDCIATAVALLVESVPLAALETSLSRLTDEYVRTERRTRAIENVLLPELETDLSSIEAALEGLDQEEVVRVHSLRTPHA